MSDAEIKNEQDLVSELVKERDFYKSEAENIWAAFEKNKACNLKCAQCIAEHDSKAVANIILNMYFGKIPSDSVGFCEIFGLKEKGHCADGKCCTDCIDSFLMEYYLKRGREENAGCVK